MTGLRWGILATGGIAHAFASDLRTAGLDLTAVGSRSAESGERFAAEFGIPRVHGSYEALVSDPDVDIVYVSTPHPMHAENAILALEHGKHVLVEKPFTLTGAEAAAVRDVAARTGLLAMEAMWTRYLPHMIRVRELVACGRARRHPRGARRPHAEDLDRSRPPPEQPGSRRRSPARPRDLSDLVRLGHPRGPDARSPRPPRSARRGSTTRSRRSSRTRTARCRRRCRHPTPPAPTPRTSSEPRPGSTSTRSGTRPTTFRLVSPDGTVLESYESHIDGRGMQFQALAAERYVASGANDSEIQPIDETVAIMGTLDEVRRQIGLRYPGED